jgi:hypothetical protein
MLRFYNRRNVMSAFVFSQSSSRGELYEVCIDRCGCRGVCRSCNASGGAKGRHQPGLLRAILSQRKLPELRAGESLYRKLPSWIARRRILCRHAPPSFVASRTAPSPYAPNVVQAADWPPILFRAQNAANRTSVARALYGSEILPAPSQSRRIELLINNGSTSDGLARFGRYFGARG